MLTANVIDVDARDVVGGTTHVKTRDIRPKSHFDRIKHRSFALAVRSHKHSHLRMEVQPQISKAPVVFEGDVIYSHETYCR